MDVNLNYIKINKGGYGDRVNVYSKAPFFQKDSIIIEDDGYSVTFTKPTLDHRGKDIKPHITKSKSCVFGFNSDIPEGKYYFDEDSTEDVKIITYRNE
jgi:hypothetical protein